MKKPASLLLAILLLWVQLTAFAAPKDEEPDLSVPPDVKGQSVLLAGAENGQIIYQKAPDQKQYPAGLTKLMTALVAYENAGLQQLVTVSPDIDVYIEELEPSMRLQPGEELTSGDLLSAIMVGSNNDAAIALAIHCMGSVEEFVVRMNEKARELGMSATNFTNVTGSHDDQQVTTARDMLTLYRQIYQTQPLRELAEMGEVTIGPTAHSEARTYWTNNHLISYRLQTKYVYSYAKGGKAASSSAGGYSVVANAGRGGTNLIAIVLNSVLDEDVNYAMVDAKDLFVYGFVNFSVKTIVKQNELMYEAKVKSASGNNRLLLYTARPLEGLILDEGSAEDAEKRIQLPESISAPIKKGDVIGSVEYSYLGNPVGSVPLVATSDIKVNIFKYVGNSILWFFSLTPVKIMLSIVLAGAALYIAVVTSAMKKHKKNRYRKR